MIFLYHCKRMTIKILVTLTESALSIRVRRGSAYSPGAGERHASAQAMEEINQAQVRDFEKIRFRFIRNQKP
jgi:hypothetical protein